MIALQAKIKIYFNYCLNPSRMAAILKMAAILDFQLDILELLLQINYSANKPSMYAFWKEKKDNLGFS